MAVIPFAFDRHRLRLTLDNPLPQPGEGRSARAFDHYLAELVRDDEKVCAFLDVYLRRFEAERLSYARAAAMKRPTLRAPSVSRRNPTLGSAC
jgi:hypothetical protein